MSPQDAYVQFVDVAKSYDGETLVVQDFNLEIARGEFLTLLGPSGSGKTTCLMMLAGFEPLTRGRIILQGRHVHNVPPYKRGIGIVFQNYALFPHMTVAENIAFPLQARAVSKMEIARRVARALDIVKLSGLDHRRPGQLSGGQQQRVALARALVFDPTLVLMDEPLGALDKQLRQQMQYEIKQIHHSLGITVIYVTHDQSEALTMSTRIAVLNDGMIEQLGSPDDVYERPETAFVAQFIGENNALAGKLRDVRGDSCDVELESGDMVRAAGVRLGGVGEQVRLSLRPERVAINPLSGKVPNVFAGRVLDLTYLGDHLRIRLDVCGRDNFVAKVTNVADQLRFRKGELVNVGWRREDCRAFRDS
jgi:putative spermidine/putrescine transport system ATP-binding protein